MRVAGATLSAAAKLGDVISEGLNINQSTLSGAIDVVVVPQVTCLLVSSLRARS